MQPVKMTPAKVAYAKYFKVMFSPYLYEAIHFHNELNGEKSAFTSQPRMASCRSRKWLSSVQPDSQPADNSPEYAMIRQASMTIGFSMF